MPHQFSLEDMAEFRAFLHLADEMAASTVYKKFPEGRIRFEIRIHNIEGNRTDPPISRDEMHAYLIVWRKLFIAQSDAGTFAVTKGLIAQYFPETRESFRIAKEQATQLIRNRPIRIIIHDGPNDLEVNFDSVSDIINGGIMHTGTEEERRVLRLLTDDDGNLSIDVQLAFVPIAVYYSKQAVNLAAFIRQENYLEQ